MPFNLESFAGNPKEELSTLRYATKQDLCDLAEKCNIVVDPAYVKARLLSNFLDYLINQEIIADDEVQALRIAAGVLPPVPVDTEVEKIRLQLQLERVKKETTERELYLEEKEREAREKEREAREKEREAREKEREAREKEREAREKEREAREKEREAREKEREAREKEREAREKEREAREKEREAREKEREAREKEREAREKEKKETIERELYLEEKRAEAREKEREAEIRHQKKLQELSLSNRKEATLPATFEVLKASKLVPDFDERDPEVFCQNFEQIAETLKWPVEFWSLLIRNKVKGKAAFVASQLVSENDYTVLKKTLLDAYSITIKGYRQILEILLKLSIQLL
ncbi:uncharacterized protein [Palaemon carinicauda]|uniref:uncharacterized protein n=1 Tax=Palaemon carinicauda TaxID=392227 RepID=UPI0035B6587F